MGRKRGEKICFVLVFMYWALKGSFVDVVNCWEILRFVSDSFFLPYSLVILFVEATRELRKGKKKTKCGNLLRNW